MPKPRHEREAVTSPLNANRSIMSSRIRVTLRTSATTVLAIGLVALGASAPQVKEVKQGDQVPKYLSLTSLEVLSVGNPGGEFEDWDVKIEIDGSISDRILRWSTTAKNVSSAVWVLSTAAVTAWPAPDSSKVLAWGPSNVPATGKTTMFHLELKPYLAAAAPELGKSYFVRIFTLGANGKTVGTGSNNVEIIHKKPGPAPKFEEPSKKKEPTVITAGHPEIVCVNYEPLNQSDPGKLVIRAYNPGFGANPPKTKPVEAQVEDWNVVARAKEGHGMIALIPALDVGETVERTFTLVPQQTVGETTVEGNWEKWRERYAKGVWITIETSFPGSLVHYTHQVLRWPSNLKYSTDPMDIHGPTEGSIDATPMRHRRHRETSRKTTRTTSSTQAPLPDPLAATRIRCSTRPRQASSRPGRSRTRVWEA